MGQQLTPFHLGSSVNLRASMVPRAAERSSRGAGVHANMSAMARSTGIPEPATCMEVERGNVADVEQVRSCSNGHERIDLLYLILQSLCS